jgi:GT2 family glycosyltransferase/glycosyltransferase involved in cell wall biosynthesis
MSNPVVSVVIPSYNHEKYIEETIESILNQTFQDFEIIITDDGSCDKTVEKIKNFSDPRIKLFIFNENQGACKALNHCINNSKGKYIAYISSDDIWELDKLEKQVKYLNKNQSVPVVFTKVKIIDENSKLLMGNHNYSTVFEQKDRSRSRWLNLFFYKGNCICHPSIMIKKSIYDDIGLYNERMANLPDLDMWVRICLKYNFHILNEKLTKFRIRKNEENVSGNKPATYIRSRFEKLQILDHYLKIDDTSFFLKIFPDAQKFGTLKQGMIPYFLARLAYETNREVMQLWALDTIYKFMQSAEVVDQLQTDYNFSYPDFLEMSAKGDIFNRFQLTQNAERLREEDKKLIERDAAIDRRNDWIRGKDAIIREKDITLREKDKLINNIDRKNDLLINDINSLIHSREVILKEKNDESKKLNSQIEKLKSELFEIQYRNNFKRSLTQRLFSKYPILYILFNKNNTSLKNTLINIKGYKAIKNNNLFDTEFYLKNNEDIKTSGADPIIHYMYHGFKENRKPNPKFDGNFYLQNYNDVKKSKLNPLVHYSLYGMADGRKINATPKPQIIKKNKKTDKKSEEIIPKTLNLRFQEYSHYQIDNILNAFEDTKKISVIVPIYNAFEDTKKCINSVLENTKIPYEMILIDDCSEDKRIKTLLDEMEKIQNIKIIRNKENKGFVKSINIGIRNSEGDVVLLNSDTIVTRKWLQKLVVAAYSNEKIGTVTPFSNAAGAFSVPEMEINNKIPDVLKLDGMANLVEKISCNEYIEVPTGNGFCMYIKRNTITNVGLFDEENFGLGYGEENDFCMRTIEKSWTNIIDDSTYIYHKRSASFSTTKKELMKKNRLILDKKHPSYTKKVREFLSSAEYEAIRNKIRTELEKKDFVKSNKKRILYVMMEGQGGTPHTNEDLMSNIQKELNCYVLTSTTKEIRLWSYKNSTFKEIYLWRIKSKWSAKDFHNPEFRDIYFNVLNGLKIDIVHIRHLFKHTFDLPGVVSTLGIPIILSLHDFYLICPSLNLLDDKNNYCAGKCTDGPNQCFIGIELGDLPFLKIFVKEWRKAVSEVLYKVETIVTTSEYAKQLYISIYPELSQKQFKIIEHGRDFKTITNKSKFIETPSKNQPIKILIPGNINIAKGGELIKSIKKEDKNSRLEFHFIGNLQSSLNLKNLGIYHGEYERNDFCKLVKKIKPSFIGIFSIWPETYCHTLSEAWDCGVPVLTTKIGAQEERVNTNGGGWFLDHNNPSKAYEEIIRIADSPEEYKKVVEQIKKITFKTTEQMANEYSILYGEDEGKKIQNAILENEKQLIEHLNVVESNKILYIIHHGGGGTPHTNKDIISHIQKDFSCYVLLSSAKEVILQRYIDDKFEEIYSWTIKSKWSAKDFHNPEFRDIYFNVLKGLKIDIVHIQHLIKHTFDLPDVASSLSIPIILSLHDFYLICPAYNLLDDENNYCAGKCTDGPNQCKLPMGELNDLPFLKIYVKEWRNETSKIFSKASVIITSTKVVKQIYTSIYPELSQKQFKIIEHGRDFKTITNKSKFNQTPSKNQPIKILIPGNINNAKGANLIMELKEEGDSRLEFHFIGSITPELKNLGIYHGEYERNDFCKLVKKIKPSFIGIFSICPETYCHTLSEAWDCGVPVLTTKIGAQEERVNTNGGGWFLDHNNPSKAYEEIIRIADSPEEYKKVVEQIKKITFKTTEQMANEYNELYQKLMINSHIPDYKDLKLSLKGKNGYLFLINDSNSEIRQHFDQSYPNKFDINRFFKNFNFKNNFFKNKNIKYYFFIIPDKSLVCKDFLQFDITIIKRNYDLIKNLIPDFVKNLDHTCYFKNDSHINYLGGKKLVYCYLNYIDNNFKIEHFNKLLNEQISVTDLKYNGDLTWKKNCSYSDEDIKEYLNEKIKVFKNKYLVDLNENIPEEFKMVGIRETEYYKNPEGLTNLKVLILIDSSLIYLKDMLSIYFKEILLYWDHGIFNEEIVDWYKPDIVLEIRTERFLENME